MAAITAGGCEFNKEESPSTCEGNTIFYTPLNRCIECLIDEDCEERNFCNTNNECQLREGTITKENTINIPNTNVLDISEDTITLENSEGLQVGSIIYGNDSQGLPYLRIIDGLEIGGGQTIVQTQQASLTDAFEHGDFSFSERVNFSPQTETLRLQPRKNFILIQNSGLEIGGSMEWDFNPDIDGDIKIRFGRLKKFELNISGNLEINSEFYANINEAFTESREISLGSFHSPPIVFPPIYIQPELSLFAGVEASSDSAGTLYLSSNQILNVGVTIRRENGLWSVDPNASASILETLVEFEVPGEVNLKGYVKSELSFELFNIIGPTVALRPYLDLNSGLNNQTPELDVDWDLYLGMNGTAGIRAEIFDITLLDKEFNLSFDLSTLLAQGTYVLNECGPQDHKRCFSDDVHSYDSCGNREDMLENCRDNTPYCKNIGLTDAECVECTTNNHCDTSETCSNSNCVGDSCEPFDHTACNNGDVWWFDSCGDATELRKQCSFGRPYCADVSGIGLCVECTSDSHCSPLEDCVSNSCVPDGSDGDTPSTAIPLQFVGGTVTVTGELPPGDIVDYYTFPVNGNHAIITITTSIVGDPRDGDVEYVSVNNIPGSGTFFGYNQTHEFDYGDFFPTSGTNYVAPHKWPEFPDTHISYELTVILVDE